MPRNVKLLTEVNSDIFNGYLFSVLLFLLACFQCRFPTIKHVSDELYLN